MHLPFFSHIGTVEAQLLTRNLAITLKAGVPLTKALRLFAAEASPARRRIISYLQQSVEGGNTLAQAMERAPVAFPAIVINLVRAGELGGILPKSLETSSEYLRRRQELVRKIRSAMLYPTFVLIATTGLGLSIGMFVLPQLIPLFTSLGVALPLSTRLLLWVAQYFEAYGLLTTVGVVCAGVAFFAFVRFEIIKPYWHRFLLFIPYLKRVQAQAAIAQMMSALSMLLQSGIPIAQAISSAAFATENRVYRNALLRTLPVVQAGRPFSEGLREQGQLFVGMTTTLAEIGEETGTLSETLAYLASYYEVEVDHALKDLTTALEPILLIGIGLIVGGTVIAIITPIYDATGSL